ncbi:hypothetical protein QTP86_034110 [Hemibagrus guttatus]|nr:hypothetical protein QTP86_034110 [Hemibagrus guttatus]
MYDNAGITRPRCEAQNTTNQDAAVKQWFMCETYADLQRLRDNASVSENAMEVIVTLQIKAPPLLQNVSINGHFNHSGLYIETQHDTVLFGCYVRNESGSNHMHRPNRTHCFAHFKDIQRMSSTTARRWSVSTVVWLGLMMMVVILVLLGVKDHVFKNRSCCKSKSIIPKYEAK